MSSAPSVLEPQCPSRLVLDRIADKWTALVIQILARGTMRYAQLQRAIGGISQSSPGDTAQSGIFTYKIGSDVDRALARALSLV